MRILRSLSITATIMAVSFLGPRTPFRRHHYSRLARIPISLASHQEIAMSRSLMATEKLSRRRLAQGVTVQTSSLARDTTRRNGIRLSIT